MSKRQDGPRNLKILSITEISVLVVSSPVYAHQSFTTNPAPTCQAHSQEPERHVCTRIRMRMLDDLLVHR